MSGLMRVCVPVMRDFVRAYALAPCACERVINRVCVVERDMNRSAPMMRSECEAPHRK